MKEKLNKLERNDCLVNIFAEVARNVFFPNYADKVEVDAKDIELRL